MPDMSQAALNSASNWRLVWRLLLLAWRYRFGCLALIVLQGSMLVLAIVTLNCVGRGIDLIAFHAGRRATPPAWPFGFNVPADWSAMAQIGAIGGAVLATESLRALLHAVYIRSAGTLVHAQIVVDLRDQVYNALQRMSFRYFDSHSTGSLINRVTGDVQSVRAFIDGVLIHLVVLLISLVCYTGYMLSLHGWLTLACLATTPALWLLTATFSRQVRPLYDRNRDLMDTLILRLTENIQGIAVVQGFGRTAEELEKFNAANRAVRDQQQPIFWRVSSFTPLIGFLTQINLVVLLAYGGYLVAQQELALGSGLVVFAGLLQQFSSQVANVTNLTNSVQQSLSGARRVFEILDAASDVCESSQPRSVQRLRGEVAFENVTFGYQADQPRLHGIDFHVRPGECVALLGATGAGKSTLLSLIARFYDPQSGRVLLDGVDARDWRLADLRRNVGLVFQETFLFSHTVAANIAYGSPGASPIAIEQAARIAAAHDFIKQLPRGYDTVLGEAGVDLSGGQRQRLAIARAVLADPAILLLDDPAAAVDPHTEEEILQAIDLAREGRTTFIVAHRLSTLRRADHILVLEEGRIVQRGTHAELFHAEGHFRETALVQLAAAAGVRE